MRAVVKVRGECGAAHMTDEKYMGAEGAKAEMRSVCEVAEGMFSHRNTLDLLCGFAERRKLSLAEHSPTLLLTRWEQIWKKLSESLIKRSGTHQKPDLVLKLAL
jgi:hypothetical protein